MNFATWTYSQNTDITSQVTQYSLRSSLAMIHYFMGSFNTHKWFVAHSCSRFHTAGWTMKRMETQRVLPWCFLCSDSCFLPSLNTILDSLKTVNYWVLIIVHARHCSKHVPELSNLMLQLSWVAISLPISFWILKSRSKLFKCCVQGHRPSQASTWTQEVWIFRAMPHSQQLHTYLLKGIFHPLWFYCWALRCS